MDDVSRRGVLRLLGAMPLLTFPACRAARAAETVDVTAWRQPGDAGDTPALHRALRSGKPARLPAGRGTGRGGDYIVDMLDLPDGAMILGEGPATVVRSSSARIPNVFHIDGSRIVTRDIVLRDMTIAGYVESDGFREHHNLINFSGVADCLIENIAFRGFASDGIYIGGELEGITRVARTNRGITIRNCSFDGVNNDNRNGISITGGTNIMIDRCLFFRCTRPDMPGPIDFEADDFPFYVFDRLSVTNCTFRRCGGNVGQIAIVTPANVRQVPRNVSIAGNRFADYGGTGSDVALIVHRRASPAMPPMNVLIENNVGTDGRAGVRLYSGRGITMRNNSWTRYLGRAFVGYSGPDDGCSDILVADRFERCGTEDGVALGIYNAAAVTVEASRFLDCGNDQPDSACIMLGQGQSNDITLRNNVFESIRPSIVPIRRAAAHLLERPLSIDPADLPSIGPKLGS